MKCCYAISRGKNKMKQDKKYLSTGEIIIYKSASGPKLEVHLKKETVWLSLDQIANLFGRDKSVISRHIKNVFGEKELDKKAVVANFATTAADGKIYKVEYYNLDVIISVGYRVKSQQGVGFRIWATKTLKQHLIQGYTINEKRLFEEKEKLNKLQETIVFLQQKSRTKLLKGQEREIIDLLADYAKTLTILEQYDKSSLKELRDGKATFVLTYEKCQKIVSELRRELMAKNEAGDFFGNERGGAFEGIIKNLYQTFGGKQLYANLESKAAHLLYLIIKDHPFSDGNKRAAAFLFVYFLDANKYLFRKNGERKINDNALAALALLIAQSAPKEKDQMIALITQLLK
ncbi:MAG: Fic/DOC family protein [Candidatus Moranbacteria bacterium GW2011_GWD2_36_12]|nr:MAG: Fic/DOC family protein [Candidatus Moranbacteria bacterium GW2011_GWD2_36_12]KKQ06955.1 MAG: Fic/DOC family protein [Candidatus Moranbacteria bacterium GW2011_GWE2_36_40]